MLKIAYESGSDKEYADLMDYLTDNWHNLVSLVLAKLSADLGDAIVQEMVHLNLMALERSPLKQFRWTAIAKKFRPEVPIYQFWHMYKGVDLEFFKGMEAKANEHFNMLKSNISIRKIRRSTELEKIKVPNTNIQYIN